MSTPLRIAVDLRSVAAGDRGGVARFALGITEALARREWLTVLPFAPHDLPELSVPLHYLGSGPELAREQVSIPSLLRKLDADVLLSPANRGLPLVSPCPMVLVLHDVADWTRGGAGEQPGSGKVRLAATNAVSLGRAALITTMSDYVAGMIRRRLGIDEERIRVVPGAVDERFSAEPAEGQVDAVRRSYGVVEGSVLHVGSIRARRDLPTLVRAVASLPVEVVPRLVLAGSGPQEESLRSMARMIGVADRLHLTGFVDDADLPSVYRAAGCLVLAGTSEGFGLPVLEAMASGLPVVAARAGALPEVVGRAGRLFPAGDAPALAGHLREILASPQEADLLRREGRARAAQFTWDRAARQMESVLREAVQTPRGRRARSQAGGLRAFRRWFP